MQCRATTSCVIPRLANQSRTVGGIDEGFSKCGLTIRFGGRDSVSGPERKDPAQLQWWQHQTPSTVLMLRHRALDFLRVCEHSGQVVWTSTPEWPPRSILKSSKVFIMGFVPSVSRWRSDTHPPTAPG